MRDDIFLVNNSKVVGYGGRYGICVLLISDSGLSDGIESKASVMTGICKIESCEVSNSTSQAMSCKDHFIFRISCQSIFQCLQKSTVYLLPIRVLESFVDLTLFAICFLVVVGFGNVSISEPVFEIGATSEGNDDGLKLMVQRDNAENFIGNNELAHL